MNGVLQPLPTGPLAEAPPGQSVFGSLGLAPSPSSPAPTESGVLIIDLRTFARTTARQSEELCPGQRIVELPLDELPELTDEMAIDSWPDGTRRTSLARLLKLLGAQRLVYRQDIPATDVTFIHGLGVVPQILLLDSSQRCMRAEITVDSDKVRIRFGVLMTFVLHLL